MSQGEMALTATGRLVFVSGENDGDWTAGFARQFLVFLWAPFVHQRFVMMMAREHFADLEQLAALAETGQVAPVIDWECSPPQVAEAMRDLEAGRVRGKVVVTVG